MSAISSTIGNPRASPIGKTLWCLYLPNLFVTPTQKKKREDLKN